MHWDVAPLAIIWLGVAIGAYDCARQTKPDRNYYPMQRIIWAALAFLGMGAGTGALIGRVNTIGSRTVFAVVLLGAVAYSSYFIRKRNHTARYLPLNLGGQVTFLDREHLRQQSETVTSFIKHGAAPHEWVRGMEEACAEWHRLERWRGEITTEAAARKATRKARA